MPSSVSLQVTIDEAGAQLRSALKVSLSRHIGEEGVGRASMPAKQLETPTVSTAKADVEGVKRRARAGQEGFVSRDDEHAESPMTARSSSQGLLDGAGQMMVAAGSAVTAGIGYGLYWVLTQG